MIDRDGLDACVHCGFCLPACPTYDVLGTELDSPRGRIALLRALAEGRIEDEAVVATHLDRCLGCRACETACPSGVPYGQMLEEGRAELQRAPTNGPARRLLDAFRSPERTTRLLRWIWLARRTGGLALARHLPGRTGAAARVAPQVSWTAHSHRVQHVAAQGARRGKVALLPGCVMDHGFADVQDAACRLLAAAGFEVIVPRGPICCGALHAHVGDGAAASELLTRLAAAIGDVDHLVVTAAGCGSHLATGPLAARARDAVDLLAESGLGFTPEPIAAHFGVADRPVRIVYDDPCHHLHGQGLREPARRLLDLLPDVERVELRDADRCCGSAGIYNVEQPEVADALLADKVDAVREAAPDLLVTANPGCHLHLSRGLREARSPARVQHVLSLLAAALPRA